MIIDRFEGDFAVVEDGDRRLNIRKALLPSNAREGDVIIKTSNGYEVDYEETERKRQAAIELLKQLGG